MVEYGDTRLPARFWDDVHPEPNTGCWLWGKSVMPTTGYGQFWWQRRNRSAHRVAYETLVGPVHHPLVIDHECNQRACVRPDHLAPKTQQENILRGDSMSARFARQESCLHGHPLTEDNVYHLTTRPGTRVCRTCKIGRERARRQRTIGVI